MKETAGAVLRELRGERRLVDIARKVGVSAAYLSEVELGKADPTLDRLDAILAALKADTLSRYRVYRAAGQLPPEVAQRLLASPETWDYDPGQMLDALQAVQPQTDLLTPTARRRVQRALRPFTP
jgi:transcriptional regulator with XRE-family HTH domain